MEILASVRRKRKPNACVLSSSDRRRQATSVLPLSPAREPVPKNRRLFSEVGAKTVQVSQKRRDHPFGFACWLLHIALLWCICVVLMYVLFAVTTSKYYSVNEISE